MPTASATRVRPYNPRRNRQTACRRRRASRLGVYRPRWKLGAISKQASNLAASTSGRMLFDVIRIRRSPTQQPWVDSRTPVRPDGARRSRLPLLQRHAAKPWKTALSSRPSWLRPSDALSSVPALRFPGHRCALPQPPTPQPPTSQPPTSQSSLPTTSSHHHTARRPSFRRSFAARWSRQWGSSC